MRISLRVPATQDFPIDEFFDGAVAPSEDYPGLVEVQRLYWFDFEDWGPAEWEELETIYQELPGWQKSDGLPYWFGVDDETPPVLSASAEIPGIQFWGILAETAWAEWEDAFHTKLRQSNLPLYAFTDD